MKNVFFVTVLLSANSLFAQSITVDMKLDEVNADSTQARFFKGTPTYGQSVAFGSVTCWGKDGNTLFIEFEKTGKRFTAQFQSDEKCKGLIKKSKGFLGLNYGTIRFVIKNEKLMSAERI